MAETICAGVRLPPCTSGLCHLPAETQASGPLPGLSFLTWDTGEMTAPTSEGHCED